MDLLQTSSELRFRKMAEKPSTSLRPYRQKLKNLGDAAYVGEIRVSWLEGQGQTSSTVGWWQVFSKISYWEFSRRFFLGEDDFPFLTFIFFKGVGEKPPTRIVRPPMTDPGDGREFYATNG